MGIPVVTEDSIAITAVNLGLARIGITNTIVSLSEQSREARTAAILFDHEYRAILRHFPWAFATKYLNLTLHSGSATVAVVGDW